MLIDTAVQSRGRQQPARRRRHGAHVLAPAALFGRVESVDAHNLPSAERASLKRGGACQHTRQGRRRPLLPGAEGPQPRRGRLSEAGLHDNETARPPPQKPHGTTNGTRVHTTPGAAQRGAAVDTAAVAALTFFSAHSPCFKSVCFELCYVLASVRAVKGVVGVSGTILSLI